MSSFQAALLVLVLTAHSSVQLEDDPGCYSLVQASQRICITRQPGEADFVDKTSRLNFEATCDFNSAAGYLQVNTSEEIGRIIIQYTCQSSNGTILADNPILSFDDKTDVGVQDFTFDSDAEVCFFYGCFQDYTTFVQACFVNSTNGATCRKETLQSSSVSTLSTSEHATVVPTITATSSAITTVSEDSQSLSSSAAESSSMTVSKSSQSLSSSAESSSMTFSESSQSLSSSVESSSMTVSESSQSLSSSAAATQQTNGSSGVSVGLIIGIIVFGFVLILVVASISILALYYSCGANTLKKKMKSYPSSEPFSGIEATNIKYLPPNFEISMEECDIVTICGSLENPVGSSQFTIEIKSKENEYVKASGNVELLPKDKIYCTDQKCSKDKIVEVTSEILVTEIKGNTKLSTKTCNGYIDSHSNTVSASTHLMPDDFEDELAEPEILSDEESSICISPAPNTRQEGCRSQNSCYTDTSSVQLDDSHSAKACVAVPYTKSPTEDITTDGYIQSEQLTGTTGATHHTSDFTDGYIDNPLEYAQTFGRVTPSDTNSSTGSYLTTDPTAEISPNSAFTESQPLTNDQPACDGYIDSPIQYTQTVVSSDTSSTTCSFATDHEYWDSSVCQSHHLNDDQLLATTELSSGSGYVDSKTLTDSQPFSGDACDCMDGYIDSPVQYTRTVGNITPSDANSSTGYFTSDQNDQHWDSSVRPPHHLSRKHSSTAKQCPSDISSDYIDSKTITNSLCDQPASSEYTVDGYIDNPVQYTRGVGTVTPSDAGSSTGYFTTELWNSSESHPRHDAPSTAKYCPNGVSSDYIDSTTFTDSQPLSLEPCQRHTPFYRDTLTQHTYNDEFVEWGSLESLTSV